MGILIKIKCYAQKFYTHCIVVALKPYSLGGGRNLKLRHWPIELKKETKCIARPVRSNRKLLNFETPISEILNCNNKKKTIDWTWNIFTRCKMLQVAKNCCVFAKLSTIPSPWDHVYLGHYRCESRN